MEDLQVALSERGLTVSLLPEKGRCLFTTRDISPGEVIISQEPYVSVPTNSSVESRCDGCFKSSNLKRCSACQVVWYCGSTCQKLEWKLHRLECHALSRLDKDRRKSLMSSIRLMVKLYLCRKLQSEKSTTNSELWSPHEERFCEFLDPLFALLSEIIPTTATDNYKLVEALVSHMSDIDEKQLVLYAQMANLINLILQWSEINMKEIAENFSKLACNAHTICDSELRPLGTGLYPVISIINHSCLPNSVLVFEGRLAVVRAVQHIPKGTEALRVLPVGACTIVTNSGFKNLLAQELILNSYQKSGCEEVVKPVVLISYIETAGSTMTRQKALKEQYLFTCTCPRCIKVGQYDDIQESAILEGYRCKDDGCTGFLLRDSDDRGFICQQCGLVRNKEEIKKIASEINFISDQAIKSTSPGHYQEASSMYKMIEKLQMKLCHPFSINLMRTREALLKILMELKDWREALAYCRLTIPVYQRVYPGFHPLLGLQYYTCGKLEWFVGDTEDAIESLTKAADILRITHGTNTLFMKELLIKLDEARAEASYKLSSNNE